MYLGTAQTGGIKALQDFRPKAVRPDALPFRTVQFATRVTKREETGGWIVGRETTGDVLCQVLWPALPDERKIPGWSNVWPTSQDKTAPLLVTPGDGERVGGGGAGSGGGFAGPGGAIPPGLNNPPTTTPGGAAPSLPGSRTRPPVRVTMRPLKKGYENDGRFGGQFVEMDGTFPQPFEGALGLVVGATNEENQYPLYFPTDPRMIAVDAAGNASCGSLVCDLMPGDRVDPTRTARLHSAFIVIKSPTGGFGWGNDNAIALNYENARQDGVAGYGAIIGRGAGGTGGGGGTRPTPPTTPGSTTPPGPVSRSGGGPARDGNRVVACMAHRPTCGPIELGGSGGDQHEFGVDADGHRINSAHVSTEAYFFKNTGHDAPLEFQDRDYPKTQDLPEKHKVHLVYDGSKFHRGPRGPARGLWRWYGEHTIGTGGGPPDEPPPPPPPPPPTTPPTTPPTNPPKIPPNVPTTPNNPPVTPPGTGRDPTIFNGGRLRIFTAGGVF